MPEMASFFFRRVEGSENLTSLFVALACLLHRLFPPPRKKKELLFGTPSVVELICFTAQFFLCQPERSCDPPFGNWEKGKEK